jgi:hypothetical protein
MSAAQYGLIAICVAGTAYVLAVAYLAYAEARKCLVNVCLKWQQYAMNRRLAKHGIAHDQVLPALMELDAFSFECGGEIWICRRGENGKYDFTRKQEAPTPALEDKP